MTSIDRYYDVHSENRVHQSGKFFKFVLPTFQFSKKTYVCISGRCLKLKLLRGPNYDL